MCGFAFWIVITVLRSLAFFGYAHFAAEFPLRFGILLWKPCSWQQRWTVTGRRTWRWPALCRRRRRPPPPTICAKSSSATTRRRVRAIRPPGRPTRLAAAGPSRWRPTAASPRDSFRWSSIARSPLLRFVVGFPVAVPRPQIVASPPPNLATLLTHCGQLILRKLVNLMPTRCQILRLKCTKFHFRRPRWGSLQRSPRLPSCI